jgi:hypothetical protein
MRGGRMKLAGPNHRWTWMMGGALLLAALSLGVPDGGCGGAPPSAAPVTPAALPPLAAEGTIDGAANLRLSGDLKVVLIWDAGGDAWKLGEAPVTAGTFSLPLTAAPPDQTLSEGAVAVAHLILVPSARAIPDGALSDDDAAALAQSALGASGTYAVVYKAAESAAHPWLAAFPAGLSCAQGQPATAGARLAGDAPQAGFGPVDCRSVRLAVGSLESAPFTNWSLPPVITASRMASGR